MRTFVNLIVLATLIALIAGGVVRHREVAHRQAAVEAVRADVRRFQQVLHLKTVTGETPVNGRGWPTEIDPAWFGKNPPRNDLLSSNRPWLEIAPPIQASRTNPMVRVANNETIASFWYNPANGSIRARIPVTISDKKATELYNRINHESLRSIFDGIDEADAPQPADAAVTPKMASADEKPASSN